MPRFEMTEQDLEALVAYLIHLGREAAPGVTETAITLGVLVPSDGPLAAAGSAAAAVLQAYVDEVNSKGGVYGRSIVLRTERLAGDPSPAMAAVDQLIDAPAFALLAAIPPQLQPTVVERVEAERVPMFSLWPPAAQENPDQRRYSFFLLAGPKQEAESLVDFAEESLLLDGSRAALIISSVHRESPVVEAVTSRWVDATEIDAPTTIDEARRIVGRLRAGGTNIICILARRDGMSMLLDAAASNSWFPYVLVPGSLAGDELLDLPSGFDGKVFLAYPLIPSDQEPDDLRRLHKLRPNASARTQHVFSEAAAYGAVSLLIEALRSAGRDLTRAALIVAVERLYMFRTGLTPPVTYGPNRRIGAAEAHIVRVQ